MLEMPESFWANFNLRLFEIIITGWSYTYYDTELRNWTHTCTNRVFTISIATRVCTRKFCIILIREWRREENACVVNERKEGRHQVVRHKMVVDKNTPFEKRAKLLSRLVTTPTHRNRANTPTIMRGWRYLHDYIWRNGARNNSNHFARVKFYENFNENSPQF